MTETILKSQLMKVIRDTLKGFVSFRLEETVRSGVPDIVLVGCGFTSWWEVKFADPDFTTTGIQELTMLRLSVAGIANYIIYSQVFDVQRTYIVHPKDFACWQTREWKKGFDHRWVAEQMRKCHAPS